jgi:hypothetical protein
VSEERDLEELQRRFAAHLRDPSGVTPPDGLDDRRLQIYRELFVGSLSGLLAGTFPVLHSILGTERWARLVRDFYRDHRCHTPLVLEVPREFVEYLGDERPMQADDPPFLQELAHYEWVELALGIDEQDLDAVRVDPDGDLLAGIPVLSPLAWPLAYRFPVHRLGPQFLPDAPPAEPSFYMACRDRLDRVRFLAVNAMTLRLVERLQQQPDLTGAAQLAALAGELPQLDPAAVRSGGASALAELRAAEILLGIRPD